MKDPQEAYACFEQRSGSPPDGRRALAFFVGYACGAAGSHYTVEKLIEAFEASRQKRED